MKRLTKIFNAINFIQDLILVSLQQKMYCLFTVNGSLADRIKL